MASLVLSASYASTPVPLSSHFHDCHQLVYVLRGSACFSVSRREYRVSSGTLILISRFEQHSVSRQSPDYARYALQIAPDVPGSFPVSLQPLLSVLVNRPESFRHALDMSGCPEMESVLSQLVRETAREESHGDEMRDLLFFQLLILLSRRHPELTAGGGAQLQRIAEIQQYLQIHYAQALSLAGLSRHFHISPSHLSHLFKSVAGQSVMEYLSACRLAAAKGLLVQTDWAVGRIVEACGFTDSSNFSRIFRAAEGLTPSQFRRAMRPRGQPGEKNTGLP